LFLSECLEASGKSPGLEEFLVCPPGQSCLALQFPYIGQVELDQQLVLLRIRFAEGPLQVSDRLAVRLLSLQQESQLQVYLTRAREGWS
jgi:hypothetical protein